MNSQYGVRTYLGWVFSGGRGVVFTGGRYFKGVILLGGSILRGGCFPQGVSSAVGYFQGAFFGGGGYFPGDKRLNRIFDTFCCLESLMSNSHSF